jgi:hypothetical protein
MIIFDVYGGKPTFLVSFYIGELQLSVILYARSRAPRSAGQSEIVAPCIVYAGSLVTNCIVHGTVLPYSFEFSNNIS